MYQYDYKSHYYILIQLYIIYVVMYVMGAEQGGSLVISLASN